MPMKPLRPCSHQPCKELTRGGPCDKHKRQRERERGSAAERGYDSRWERARKEYLRTHPLCAECARQKRITAATVVDHIIPHKGDYDLFWDETNWQSLCKPDHDAKTAREDGGFGRLAKS